MAIEWNKVTRLSQIIAIVLGVVIFGLGFWLGMQYGEMKTPTADMVPAASGVISDVSYQCGPDKEIHALYYDDKVTLMLSDGRTYNLPHVISGSGVRYANDDESVVFWEKGKNATLTEGTEDGGTDSSDCVEAPIPE